jgi:hypothetical protein
VVTNKEVEVVTDGSENPIQSVQSITASPVRRLLSCTHAEDLLSTHATRQSALLPEASRKPQPTPHGLIPRHNTNLSVRLETETKRIGRATVLSRDVVWSPTEARLVQGDSRPD